MLSGDILFDIFTVLLESFEVDLSYYHISNGVINLEFETKVLHSEFDSLIHILFTGHMLDGLSELTHVSLNLILTYFNSLCFKGMQESCI